MPIMKVWITPMKAYMKAKILKTIVSVILLTVYFGVNARTYLVSVGIADYSGFTKNQ